jgi:putative GTP pyrophosphokinase
MPTPDFEFEQVVFRDYYERHRRQLEDARAFFSALLAQSISDAANVSTAKIEGRIKESEECIRKFSRKYRASLEEKSTPYEIAPHITDLNGLRVVCLYEDEIEKIAKLVKEHFEVIGITDRLSTIEGSESSFGYKGLHMDLRLNTKSKRRPECTPFASICFELQVRTIIQDSWSALDHEIKYKKSIPTPLKRRISVLAALFELADREFRQIRDETEAALHEAPDETTAIEPVPEESTQPDDLPNAGGELNAFTFLKIAKHFFNDYDFEPHKVDGFVQDVVDGAPGITRKKFNQFIRENIGRVKRYKQYFESLGSSKKLNPYTVMRHCLYLGDKPRFHSALTKIARDTFEDWLAKNP